MVLKPAFLLGVPERPPRCFSLQVRSRFRSRLGAMQESGPSAQTTLKRTGVVVYTGMLVSKAAPQGWVKETLLLRFVERSGVSTVFIITGEALAQFRQCEPSKIYDVEVPGRAVRSSSGSTKIQCEVQV